MLIILILILGVITPFLGLFWPPVMVTFFSLIPISIQLFPSITIFGVQQSIFGVVALLSLPIMFIGALISFQKYFKFLWPLLLPVLALSILSVLNAKISGFPMTNVIREAGGIFYFALMISLCFVVSQSDYHWILKYVFILNIIISLCICISALLDFTVLKSVIRIDYRYRVERMSSFFLQNPTDLGCYTLLFFSLTFTALLKRNSICWALLSLIYAFIIMATYSLACIGGLFICMIVIYVLTKAYKKIWIWVTGAFSVLLISIIMLSFKLYHSHLFDRVRGLGTGLDRFKIWDYCLKLIQKKPILGYTTAMAKLNLEKYLISVSSAHNAFLSWFLGYGIIGFLLIAWILFWIGQKLFAMVKANDDIVSIISIGCFSYLISLLFFGLTHSFTPNTLFLYPFWILSIIVIGSQQIKRE